MHINFNGFGFDHSQMDIVLMEIQVGNQVVQRIEVPMMFASAQFRQICREVSQSDSPMQAKCFITEYTESGTKLDNFLAFQNKAFTRNFGEGEQNV